MWWQFSIDAFEVFLYQSRSMGMCIILVQNPPVLQFRVFPINMLSKHLQDLEALFLVDGHLRWHKMLIKSALVVKEHNYDLAHGLLLLDLLLPWFIFPFPMHTFLLSEQVIMVHPCLIACHHSVQVICIFCNKTQKFWSALYVDLHLITWGHTRYVELLCENMMNYCPRSVQESPQGSCWQMSIIINYRSNGINVCFYCDGRLWSTIFFPHLEHISFCPSTGNRYAISCHQQLVTLVEYLGK